MRLVLQSKPGISGARRIQQPDCAGLLLACLQEKAELPGDELKRLSETEWEGFAQEASRQAVSGLLYQRLELGKAEIPEPARGRLRAAALETAVRNMRLYQELRRALLSFQAIQAPAIVLKGAYLAQAVYGDLAARQMNDLDLLVQEADLERARDALHELGYRFERKPQRERQRHHHHRFLLLGENISFEMHWELQPPTHPYRMDPEGLWRRARQVKLAGVQSLSLAPEDLLLHNCLHLAYHHGFGYFALRGLCDIARICAKEPVDWDRFTTLATQSRGARAAALALQVAKALLAAEAPESAVAALEPAGVDPRLAGWAAERIVANDEAMVISKHFTPLPAPNQPAGRARVFLGAGLPPRASLGQIYLLPVDSKRLYLYYPLHAALKFLGYLRKAWLLRSEPLALAWLDRDVKGYALIHWMAGGRLNTARPERT